MDKKPNKILQWLKSPKWWFLVAVYLLTALLCAGAITVAVVGSDIYALELLSYALFAFAALFLGYSIYTIVIMVKPAREKIIATLKRHKLTSRILEQYGFRTVVFATFSFALSIAFVAFNGVVAVASKSIWYGALTIYYLALTFLRGYIVFYHRRKSKTAVSEDERKLTECKKYRNSGVLLMLLPFALSCAIIQMSIFGSSFVHWGWTVFAFAAYAFYKIIMAIYNVVKAKKTDDMTVRALRNIGLAAALGTMLALQTSLLHSFSEGDYGWANTLTGSLVCVLTFAIGTYMIISGNRGLVAHKRELEERLQNAGNAASADEMKN